MHLYTTDKDRKFLSTLTYEQKWAIIHTFLDYNAIASKEKYVPLMSWTNFSAEIMHSALLQRLLSGKKPLEERPL